YGFPIPDFSKRHKCIKLNEIKIGKSVIIDRIENFENYKKISRRLQLAFDFILNYKKKKMCESKYEADGNKIYGLVQRYHTQPSDKLVWEAHRKYIDVQCILEGEENMGYAHISDMEQISEYIESDDYALFKGDGAYFKVKGGFFTIFLPHDCHKVRMQTEDGSCLVKKIVVKIHI
ncbi:MAG: YhcH/YjgK/YiaL family protein, partial [Candidatus Omnitrophica bacterium]|nr:YhcH/YjgK/YiaL family protein [Candidatus Omnitrophota bacterium]